MFMFIWIIIIIIKIVDIHDGMLPTHDEEPEFGKRINRQWLGEDVGELVFGCDVLNCDVAFGNCMTEVVVFNVDVFGTRTHLRHFHHFDSTHVVFEDLTSDYRSCSAEGEPSGLYFTKQAHHWKDIAEGLGE